MATVSKPHLPSGSGKIEPVIVKLGKQDRSRIKKLLRGQGSLMQDVETAIDQLKTAGTIAADAQPVIVVVREKPRGLSLFA